MMYLFSVVQLPYIYFVFMLLFLIPLSVFVVSQLLCLIKVSIDLYNLSRFKSDILSSHTGLFSILRLLTDRRLWFDSIKLMELNRSSSQLQMHKYFNALGFVYYSMQKYDLAKFYYLQSLAVQDKYIVALQNLAKVYDTLRDTESALLIYKRVLDQDPGNKTAIRYIDSFKF